MLKVIAYSTALLLLAFAALWLSDHPGHVTLIWLGWGVEMSVAVVIGLMAAALFTLMLLVALLRAVIFLPRRVRRQRRERYYALGLRSATESLVALGAGDAASAKRLNAKAARYLPHSPLPLLLSAQAARLQGDDAALRQSLEAMLEHRETQFLAARGLSEYFDRSGNAGAALPYAEQAHGLHRKNPAALHALIGLYARRGAWQEALSALKGHWFSPSPERRRLQGVTLLAKAEQLERTGELFSALAVARRAFHLLPDFAPASALYAKLLQAEGKQRASIAALKKAWSRAPHPLLSETLLALPMNAQHLFRTARRFAALHPEHQESMLLVAAAALRAHAWDAARSALKAALAQEESNRACRLMAQLEREAYNDAEAAALFARKAGSALPEAVWTCRACGYKEHVWQPHCPSCHAFDSMEWRSHSLRYAEI